MDTAMSGTSEHHDQKGSKLMTKMPHEILQQIGSMSALAAVTSMALTCKRMMLILGMQYVTQLKWEPADKLELVHLLARDLPYYVACEACQSLHKGDKHEYESIQKKIAQRLRVPACVQRDRDQGIWTHFSTSFDSITFRAIMKRHRLGLEHLEQLSCFLKILPLARTRALMPEAYNNVHVSQLEVVPRIVNSRFLLRTQDWFVFSERDDMRWWSGLINSICPHSSLLWSMAYRSSLKNWLRAWNDRKRNFLANGSIVLVAKDRCTMCHTEWHLCVRRLDTPGDAIVLTRWMDLGAGLSSQDEQWKWHLRNAESGWHRGSMREEPQSVGVLEALFEDGEPHWEELLWPANAENLLERLIDAEKSCETGEVAEIESQENLYGTWTDDEELSEMEEL